MDQNQTENEKLLARRHWKLINCPRVCLPGVGIYSGNVSQCSCLVVKGRRGRESVNTVGTAFMCSFIGCSQ